MIESALMTYGPLGLWTISLLAERYYYNKKMQVIIDNNTTALTKFTFTVQKCEKK